MLSPLTKGYGTWTGNVNPYDDDGEDSDTSLPESEVPHRHGITVGFVSRTPSATAISPAYRQSSGHARPISSRDGARSARRSGSAREPRNVPSSPGPLRREQTDSQISLSKTYTTKKGALMLFSATEEELEMYSKPSSKYRVKFNKKPVDLIDTSLRLGTLDKLVMSVLKFGEDELEADGSTKGSIKEEKEKLFMKFLNRIDEMDVDIRSKPGGEMKEYMRDLKKTTSVKLGLTGETLLPHDKDAMELRAILRGLQNNRWPFIYKPDADQPDFSQPSPLAYKFSRRPSHLKHPPHNKNQRILSSKKLEDSLLSLKSYLGRSLDDFDEVPPPLLTRRRAKHDKESARQKYARDKTDEEFKKHWSQRPHTNTPTQGEDLHEDYGEEGRDKLGEIIDPKFPRDDRGRIEMIEIPHPTTPRSTEIATEDKLSPRPKSESSSKLGEKLEDEVGPETLISVTKKSEFPIIPDYLKPKPQPKSQLRKDQKKKVQKGKKTPIRVPTGKTDKPKATPTEKQDDEITQIIKKKVTLPPENEYSVIPDFVGEALQRSKERSKQQLEQEFKEKQDMIGQELSDTLFEGQEGMTAEELELAKKALREREETAREKLKDKTLKKPDDKLRKSTAGSSSVKSKKGKGGMANIAKDTLQQEKERLKMLKEQEKQGSDPQRLLEIKAIEDRIAASSDSRSTEEKKFKDKLQTDHEVQMELERIEREAEMADQTEQDVRAALREDRLRRMEEKARQKKEELARKKQQQFEKRMLEKQKKEEAKAAEKKRIMMNQDEQARKKEEEELQKRLLLEEEEEEKRRKEEEEEDERRRREEEELIWQREEEAEQESMKRILEEQDELRRKQEMMAAEKEKLLEEQRRRKELQALEEQRQREELERIKMEEIRKMQEEKARTHELQKLEEDVRENMRQEMERRKNEALMRREYNLEAKSNLNKMKHSQGITRAWVWSYFIDWPIETYLRPIGEAEKKKKEAKLREKRKKAR